MRILFLSHTRSWSGAEVAMMRLVSALGPTEQIAIASPREGRVATEAERLGLPHYPVPGIDLSLRLDPVETPKGLAQLVRGGRAVRRAAREFGAEVVHANTLRAGLMATLGTLRGRPGLVVQSHEHLKFDPVSHSVRQVLSRSAEAVVAVCDHTAENFNSGLRHPVAERVYISIDHDRFAPDRVDPAPIRDELGLAAGVPLLGQVAQITPWKCQDVAIRALAHMRDHGSPAHLLFIGNISFSGRAVRYDNETYRRGLLELVQRLDLGERVHWLGWREDVPALVRALDLSLLPSHDEPFGTSAAESMAVGTPILVSDDGGPSEYVLDGESGRVLPQGRAEAWAAAALALLDDRVTLQAMGHRAVAAAAGFTDAAYGRAMLSMYRRVAGGREP